MGAYVEGRLRLPRRFASHLNRNGFRFREHYEALLAQLGPFINELQRQAAADVAQYHVTKLQAVEAWEQAVSKRATGRGRKPSTGEVIRLAKRMALESQSYTLAFNRLQDLVGTPKRSAHDELVKQYGGGA